MLSQSNIDKLHVNGIYKCEPVLSWLPSYKRNNPYWCRNWTFKVKEYKGHYAMYDTYWSTGDDYPIELTDVNFDKFEYLFDLDDIRYIHDYESWLEYPEEDRWRLPLDSGGTNHAKYVIRRGAKKVKERVVDRMQRDINYLRQNLVYKERLLENIIDGSVDYNLY